MKRLLFLLPISLFASKVILPPVHPTIPSPWFTGPLLAPSAYIVTPGHVNYEPYIYAIMNPGFYNRDWQVEERSHVFSTNSLQPDIEIGVVSWFDIELYPTLYYNYTDHQARWTFGDFPIQLNIQLYTPPNPESWIPAVKLNLTESFPTGKYRHLNPKKQGTDFGGSGSFETSVGLTFGKLWHLGRIYFMTTRLFVQYTLPAPSHLKGFNVHGGGYGTDARFFPRTSLTTDFGVEINLSQHWALACDITATWLSKSHFTGNPGLLAPGVPATLGSGSGAQFTLAPAIEYNWNENLGLIAGSWFTFAGRESLQFWSGVLAINYYQ